jgi:sugar transferase (PEP-CTERM system associated)
VELQLKQGRRDYKVESTQVVSEGVVLRNSIRGTHQPRFTKGAETTAREHTSRIRLSSLKLLGNHVPSSMIFLALAELAVCFFSALLVLEPPHMPSALLFSFAALVGMGSMGLYHRRMKLGLIRIALQTLLAFAVVAVFFVVMYFIRPSSLLYGWNLLSATTLACGGVLLLRTMYVGLRTHEKHKQRVLVIGCGQQAQALTCMSRHEQRGFTIVAFLRVNGEKGVRDRARVIRHDRPLVEIARIYDIDEMVVAVDDRRNKLPMDQILDCRMSGIRVSDLPTFYERETGKIMLEMASASWLIFNDGFHRGPLWAACKRFIDITASVTLLLLFLPIMLLISAALFLESRGRHRVLYKQVRVGLNGRLFKIVKFRSMRPDAEADGVARWATADDQRITRVGGFIRRTRLDELPQLFNVLKGEMSLVGPRPERPEFAEKLAASLPYYKDRCRVKPGVTGWAQICFHYGASERDAFHKLQYDLYYMKNSTWLLDLIILLQTVEIVLWGKGSR